MQARKVAALAEARKAADAKRRIMSEDIARENAVKSKIYFEINTSEKINAGNRQRAISNLRDEHGKKLHGRRTALANIMNVEMDTWKAECLGGAETMESRKAK